MEMSLSAHRGRTRWIGIGVALAILVAGALVTGRFPRTGDHFGLWSVVPPLVALGLAFALREVVSALFIGIAVGGVISGKPNIVQEFLIPSIGSPAIASKTAHTISVRTTAGIFIHFIKSLPPSMIGYAEKPLPSGPHSSA